MHHSIKEVSSKRGFGVFVALAATLGAALAVALLAACAPEPDEAVEPSRDGDVAKVSSALAAMPTLDPTTIPQFVEPLVVPPVMPSTCDEAGILGAILCRWLPYEPYFVAARQFEQQVLPRGYPKTTVWGYGRAFDPVTGPSANKSFHSPSFTFEVRRDRKVRIWWYNQLVDRYGRYRPHLLPIDQTLHWANPPGPPDSHSMTMTSAPYLGPVPITTHVHGGHNLSNSDGLPEQWFLPAAWNIPAGYSRRGTGYASTIPAPLGAYVADFPNDQRASTVWYHDHALGMTRANVYAGLAGFYLVRDAEERALNLPGPAPRYGDRPGTRYYEIPLAIQDRSFNADGSLFYPDSREFFDGYPGPYVPETDVSPIWNPEFFGNAIIVNGHTWPYLEVEPRLYRFRVLNGCNSRFLILDTEPDGIVFHQIGGDGGLLPDAPVDLDQLLLGPGERYDVIVDFSSFEPGEEIMLTNVGPDAPFGGLPIDPAELANPATTGRVMLFRVVPLTGAGTRGEIPEELPPIEPLAEPAVVRDLTLNEMMSMDFDGPVMALLGTADEGPLLWDDPLTELPELGSIEDWRLINLTADAHPIHLHGFSFQVMERAPLDAQGYDLAYQAYLNEDAPQPVLEDYLSAPFPPEDRERGWKDTVIAYPDEVTVVRAAFDLEGEYAWHCHILEHEDNEMMRPLEVVTP